MENKLVRLNVIDRSGKKTSFDVSEGTTVRDAIANKLLPTNFGNCGGDCICGSCQVHISPEDFNKFDSIGEEESGTLESMAIKPVKHSRLGCQIKLKKEQNDITVTIAPD